MTIDDLSGKFESNFYKFPKVTLTELDRFISFLEMWVRFLEIKFAKNSLILGLFLNEEKG